MGADGASGVTARAVGFGLPPAEGAALEVELAVPPAIIERFGAVSEETALSMAQGALGASRAQWAIAVTGIAGPAGGSPEKPVGTVCFAWVGPGVAEASRIRLDGDRAAVRRESVRIALKGVLDRLA